MYRLCDHLAPIVEFLFVQGNRVARIEDDMWTEADLVWSLDDSADLEQIRRSVELAPVVTGWQHGSPAASCGVLCCEHRHGLRWPQFLSLEFGR